MRIEVGIFYADGIKVWKPLSEISNFRKDGVLTITLTSERGNRSALLARMWSYQNNDRVAKRNKAWWGDDNYVVGIMPDNRFFTYQYSDYDDTFRARSTIDGSDAGTIQRPSMFPTDAIIYTFIGAYLEPLEWEKALIIFERDMF